MRNRSSGTRVVSGSCSAVPRARRRSLSMHPSSVWGEREMSASEPETWILEHALEERRWVSATVTCHVLWLGVRLVGAEFLIERSRPQAQFVFLLSLHLGSLRLRGRGLLVVLHVRHPGILEVVEVFPFPGILEAAVAFHDERKII